METSNKKDIRPVSRFQKIRLLSFYPLLAIAATWYIVKIGTFKIDWPLVPLVLFIIAVVSQTVGIAKREIIFYQQRAWPHSLVFILCSIFYAFINQIGC